MSRGDGSRPPRSTSALATLTISFVFGLLYRAVQTGERMPCRAVLGRLRARGAASYRLSPGLQLARTRVRHRRTAHPLPSAPIPMLEFAFEMPGGGVDSPLFAIARRAGPGACCPRPGARACAGAGLASRPLTLRRAEVSGQLQAFRLRQPKRAEGRRRPAWVPGHVR